MPEAYNEQNQLILSLLCITALIASGILYARTGTSNELLGGQNSTNGSVENGSIRKDNMENGIFQEAIENITKPKFVIKLQPSCPPLKKDEELNVICRELLFTKFSCRPEDVTNPAKHKIPKYYYAVRNNSTNETQNTIVNCIIAILLLTSLGAALLEFYRAKLSPPPDGAKKGAKAPINRKCSLADLTVLKHHRKELVRRESILEHPSEETSSAGNMHQGFKPSPLHRRCSFPASFPSNDGTLGAGGGGGFSTRRNSRKFSMTGDISRRQSAADGSRKLSMVTDEDIWRRGSLVGEDSSPERRHHTRLVHRH